MTGGRPVAITKDRLLKLIEKHGGIHAEIAKDAKLTRQCVWKRINADDELKAACKQAREHLLDECESGLRKAIRSGKGWAIKFYLLAHGKERGYTRQINVSGSIETASKIILTLPDDGREQPSDGSTNTDA